METQVSKRKKMIGTVVSNKMQKTVVVEVEKLFKHPKYKKYVKKRKRYKAHDENNSCQIGDKVLIVETRPLSKEKRWLVKQILERRQMPQPEEVIKDDTDEVQA
ncbi:MAG: 30S ribosomal protein S17 [Desulfobacterota bacterium]|nr:30S ribosomal protein S17 [Thermodesulfobacteriota bacterium]MDW8002383.1 30S ribosomal protein S17 [Deltaproteobacteria bacterium]